MDDLQRRAEEARTAARHIRAKSQELRRHDPTAAPAALLPLSPRELEVLKLLAAGLPTKAIALQLGISRSTVDYYLAQVYRKLRVHSRVDAAVAYRRAVIERPETAE